MIIVLGESLIAAGLTAGEQPLTAGLLVVTITAVAGTCALWWTYFGWAKDALERAMRSQPPASIGRFARDVYSFAHFPLIFGVIGFAVAVEESIAHPKDPLSTPGALALCVGVGLILGSTGLALRLADVPVPPARWWASVALLLVVPLFAAVPAWIGLTVVSVLIAGVALLETGQRTPEDSQA